MPQPKNLLRFTALLSASFAIGVPAALAAPRSAYVLSELTNWNSGLSSGLRAEKYGSMDADMFSFYRGTNHLFWKDNGTSSSLSTYGNVADTRIWLSGDMHANNMGSFNNDQGTIVYDLNDFDEATLGDYQLDLWRLNVSLVLIMRTNGGFSSADESTVIDACTEHYLDTIEDLRNNGGENVDVFVATNTYGQLDDFLLDTASKDSTKKLLDKYTLKDANGNRYFSPAASSDITTVDAATVSAITAQMANYGATLSGGRSYSTSYFKVKSIGQRLHAGIGSLGAPRYYVLIEGASTGQDDDIILDVKAQTTPSAYLNLAAASKTATDNVAQGNAARRVVKAAKALGNYVDDYLGWMTVSGQIYSVRQRSPWKETMQTTTDASGATVLTSLDRMTKMAEQWGTILATAHCRADWDADPAVVPYDFNDEVYQRINGNHDAFRSLQRSLALPYANQVQDDYNAYKALRAAHSL